MDQRYCYLLTYSTVPLSLAAPAATAGLAYLSAKTNFAIDYRTVGSSIKARFWTAMKERRDRLNLFYTLEDYAKGKLANEVFLIFEGRQWTYLETYTTVLRYGTWLQKKHGVKPKQIVAMDFLNSEKFIFIWFGLWSFGAKPAFINYNLSGKPLEHCIRVSTTSLILVDPEVAELVTPDIRNALPNVEFVLFSPDVEAEVMATEGIRAPDSTRSEEKSENMAKLVFTSGTTGLPKPAIVSWMKINVASLLVPKWSSFGRGDIFYTVSQTSIFISLVLI